MAIPMTTGYRETVDYKCKVYSMYIKLTDGVKRSLFLLRQYGLRTHAARNKNSHTRTTGRKKARKEGREEGKKERRDRRADPALPLETGQTLALSQGSVPPRHDARHRGWHLIDKPSRANTNEKNVFTQIKEPRYPLLHRNTANMSHISTSKPSTHPTGLERRG